MVADVLRAERAAEDLVRRYGVGGPKDIEVEAIAWGEGVLIQEAPMSQADAWLLRDGETGVVRVRESLPFAGQKRFAAAHEIGHWCLHANLRQEWFCTAADLAGYSKRPEEVEANRFACVFLMPRDLVTDAAADLPFSFRQVQRVGRMFQVGPIVTARRLLEVGHEDGLLVAHHEGNSLYYQRSTSSTFDAFLPRRTVPAGVPHLQVGQRRLRRVSLEEWFPEERCSGTVEEHTYRVAEEGPTLTVLIKR